MNRTEKFELALIPLFTVAVIFSEVLPEQISIGNLILWLAGLFLGQGLLRDLWFLANAKSDSKPKQEKRSQCLCLESMLGITGIIVGTLFFVSGINQIVLVEAWQWSVLILLATGAGFLIKDYVLHWFPFRLRRDTNHMNIIFNWKPSK